MKAKLFFAALIIFFCAYAQRAATGIGPQDGDAALSVVTLNPPRDPVTNKMDTARGGFSFSLGAKSKDFDLGYSFLKIAGEDYFQVAIRPGTRSCMKDLGKHEWSDSFKIPVLEPLPELKPGEQRNVTVDSSGDTHGQWKKTTPFFAKAALDHIYLVHVKDAQNDFYVLFRVESLYQGRSCIITWKRIPSPEK